jgi:hypothetical protein
MMKVRQAGGEAFSKTIAASGGDGQRAGARLGFRCVCRPR